MISPCEKTCVPDYGTQECTVCGRTIQEIIDWSSYTHSQKKEVVKRLKKKKLDITE
jgi:predicted Fe-S protein YdhL (DUF1289 family)